MTSDESLILAFKAGSPEAFEELFARYRELVYSFFRRRVPTQAAADDLAQETWMAVLKGAVRYEPRALFRSYLFAIAFRLMLAERRKNARSGVAGAELTGSLPPAVESQYWIREALNKLEPLEREILMLREYEQLSYDEIAGLLHIPVNTVRSRLFRARLATRQLLEPRTETGSGQGRL